MTESWFTTYWPIVAFALSAILLPAIGWAIRMGLASKADLAREMEARAKADGELEGRVVAKLEQVSGDVAELSDRVLRVETEIKHLPSADDIAELKGSVMRTEAQIGGLQREMESVGRSMARIEDFMFGGSKA